MALRSAPTLFSSSWITMIIAVSISLAPMLNMAQLCFTPNGIVLHGYGLCDPTSSTSVCCKLTENCLDNGLCSTLSGFVYRGGCTDGSFKSESCPQTCLDNFERPWLAPCQKSADGSGVYCCDGDNSGSCCNDSDSTFFMKAVVTSVKSVSETTTRSYTTSSSSSITKPATTESASTASASTASASTASASTTSASTSTSTAMGSTNSSGSGHKVGVGVGVGVAAVVIIALALLWFFRRRRNKNHKRSGYGDLNLPHEVEALKSLEMSPELAHDRTTEIPAELSQGHNHPVELDSGVAVSHLDGASNEPSISGSETSHPHGVPNESSSLPALSQDFQRTVRPAFSTSSIVHPGLLDAAATASRFLDQPNPAPTPVQTPEPPEQQATSSTQNEASAPLSPDENPLMPFPPKSSSKSHHPPPLSANQPSPAVADRLNPPTSKRPFHSAPATPKKALHQIFATAPKQPSIQVVPPTPQQSVKGLPSLPTAERPVAGNAPSTVKAMLRNHPQPLQSNTRPLSFAAPPSNDWFVHEPHPVDFPLRSSSMAGPSVMDPSNASTAHQDLDPAGGDSNSTDFAISQPSTHHSNAPQSNAPNSSAVRNYSHKLSMQQMRQSQEFRDGGDSSAHAENMF